MSDDVTGESAQIDDQAAPSAPTKKSTAKASAASSDTTEGTAITASADVPVEARVEEPVFPAHEELPSTGGSFIRQADGSLTAQEA